MATIDMTMTSLGTERERCVGHGGIIPRGSTMHGVTDSDGEPMGWYCLSCVMRWYKGGVMPEPPTQSEVTR